MRRGLGLPALLTIGAVLRGPAPLRAEPSASVQARSFQPGEALLVEVRGHHEARPPSGTFLAQTLTFFKSSPGTYLAVAGLDLDVSTGPRPLHLRLYGPYGTFHPWRREILVAGKEFPMERLTVDPDFVRLKPEDEARAERERVELEALFNIRTPSPLFDGSFGVPVETGASTSFGHRRVFNEVPRSPHSGSDLRVPRGTLVRAPAAGMVVLAGTFFFHGKVVVLDHGLGIYTLYGHLSAITVPVGRMVRRREPLGKVGTTGRATGPHLHWAARVDGARVDPFSLASLDLDGLPRGR